MGHGASTGGKKGSVLVLRDSDDQSEPKPVWTRSNSDGCIVESLNTSKTKVDLLEMQVSELKELLRASEHKHQDAEGRAATLEKQLAEVEGVNFELTDRVSDLEQQLESLQGAAGSEVNVHLEQELAESSQEVEKLEMHVKLLEEQMASMRSKFRKKLRAANTQVTEAKQESSLKLYSLKDQIKQLEEENVKLSERLERAASASSGGRSGEDQTAGEEDSRTMVILELSSQVSRQEDQLAGLQEHLEQRDRTIADLTQQLSQQRPVSEASSRPPSGLTGRPSSGRGEQSSHHKKRPANERKGSGGSRGRSLAGESPSDTSIDCLERTAGGMEQRCDDRLARDIEQEEKGSNTVARRKRRESLGQDKDEESQGRRHSLSRERRRSASKDRKRDRTEGDPEQPKSLEGPTSTGHGREVVDETPRQKGRVSKNTKRGSLLSSTADIMADMPSNKHKSNSITSRTCSAGSRDSAFHEAVEEGTKSAPSSAGSTRTRRQPKAGQQRAASLDMIDNGGKRTFKPTSGIGTDSYDGDSGLDETRRDGANDKSSAASDQELDDLLQELMSDDRAPVSGGKSRGEVHSGKFGISKEKIRSLLSDSTA